MRSWPTSAATRCLQDKGCRTSKAPGHTPGHISTERPERIVRRVVFGHRTLRIAVNRIQTPVHTFRIAVSVAPASRNVVLQIPEEVVVRTREAPFHAHVASSGTVVFCNAAQCKVDGERHLILIYGAVLFSGVAVCHYRHQVEIALRHGALEVVRIQHRHLQPVRTGEAEIVFPLAAEGIYRSRKAVVVPGKHYVVYLEYELLVVLRLFVPSRKRPAHPGAKILRRPERFSRIKYCRRRRNARIIVVRDGLHLFQRHVTVREVVIIRNRPASAGKASHTEAIPVIDASRHVHGRVSATRGTTPVASKHIAGGAPDDIIVQQFLVQVRLKVVVVQAASVGPVVIRTAVYVRPVDGQQYLLVGKTQVRRDHGHCDGTDHVAVHLNLEHIVPGAHGIQVPGSAGPPQIYPVVGAHDTYSSRRIRSCPLVFDYQRTLLREVQDPSPPQGKFIVVRVVPDH